MTREQFINAKTEIAKKALPHLVDPEGYGPSGLNSAECALLMSPDERHVATAAQFAKEEKTALLRLGARLRSLGITCAADCLPPRD